jgi:hypothetical protein
MGKTYRSEKTRFEDDESQHYNSINKRKIRKISKKLRIQRKKQYDIESEENEYSNYSR